MQLDSPLNEALMAETELSRRASQAFEIVLGREPTTDELNYATDYLRQRNGSGEAAAHLVWALVASAEFSH